MNIKLINSKPKYIEKHRNYVSIFSLFLTCFCGLTYLDYFSYNIKRLTTQQLNHLKLSSTSTYLSLSSSAVQKHLFLYSYTYQLIDSIINSSSGYEKNKSIKIISLSLIVVFMLFVIFRFFLLGEYFIV